MEEKAKSCRSPAVTKLTQVQLDYRRRVDELKQQVISDLHSAESSPEEDESEAGMLYAEFAMDFATLAMQQALISALSALDGQKLPDSDKADNRRKGQIKEEAAVCKK